MYRGECVHSLSPAPVRVLGGGNGPVMKQRVVLCKHTPTRFVGICGVCVCVCVCVGTLLLIKVTLFLISLLR